MDMTPRLKHRFCKDANLPINIYEEPFFMKRLELFDPFFGTLEKWDVFQKDLEEAEFENEEAYFEEYNRIKEAAITSIKESKTYQQFISCGFNNLGIVTPQLPYPTNLYKPENAGRCFISIDMKKANFTCLKEYEKRFCEEQGNIFNGSDTWEGFINQFTGMKHIIQSKYIRQVIMGALNPKRQVTFEKYLMNEYFKELKDLIERYELVIASFTNDEIVLTGRYMCLTAFSGKDDFIDFTLRHKNELRYEEFRLDQELNDIGWCKIVYHSNPCNSLYFNEYKCVDAINYPFILRHTLREPAQWEDKVFYHEGRLAMLLEEPKIKWLSENDWMR